MGSEIWYCYHFDDHSAHVDVEELFFCQMLSSQVHYALVILTLQFGDLYSILSAAKCNVKVSAFPPYISYKWLSCKETKIIVFGFKYVCTNTDFGIQISQWASQFVANIIIPVNMMQKANDFF